MKRFRQLLGAYLRLSDSLLLFLCLLAAIFGMVLIYSATRSYGSERYLIVQGVALVLGLVLFVFFSLVDSNLIADRWMLLLGFNLALLLILKLFGTEGGTGNRSWLRFGPIGIQPSEILKITFAMLLSKQMAHLRETRRGLSSVGSVVQLAAHFGLMFGLIVIISSDLGSALSFLFIFAAMCFAGGLTIWWFLLALGAGAAAAPLLWTKFLREDQRNRILAPYIPDKIDPDGLGVTWQARQSKVALASGGATGQGFLHGVWAQGDLLPFKHTDFIFSVAGEELGLIGCALIVILLTVIILRVLHVGLHCGNYRDMVLCVGIAGFLTFQTFENIGMCVGLTPVIGITLPFFSYGGSSMVSCFAAMGIVSGIRFRQNTRSASHRL